MDDARWADALQRIRTVRHDANNPLTAALGHVQLLLDDPAVTDPEVRATLGIVVSELRRLAEVLRRLNDLNVPAGADGAARTDSA